MALATQCPHCHTTFRVAQDQLKLRAGLVRCGSCKEIFNGIEHLLRHNESEQTTPSARATTAQSDQATASRSMPPGFVATPQEAIATPPSELAPEEIASDAPANQQEWPALAPTEKPTESEPEFTDFFDLIKSPAQTAPDIAQQQEQVPDISIRSNDPLQRMTLMIVAEGKSHDVNGEKQNLNAGAMSGQDSSFSERLAPENPNTSDPLDQAIEDLQRKPMRRAKDAARRKEAEISKPDETEEEPGFVKKGKRRQRVENILNWLMVLASFILFFALIAQGIYIFRNQIAARFPQAKPLLAQACTILQCSVGLPAQIEAVSIESSELQTLAANKGTFLLSILLRNHSQTIQAWPNIELTLNDTSEKAIARRVFTPRDYLPAIQDLTKGVAPTSEQPIKLYFELSQLKASGYRVYLYYP